jgi:Ice-binding-like
LGGNGAVININLATVTGNVGAQNSTKVMESAPSTVTGDFVVGSSANTSGIKGSHGPIVVDDSLLAQAVSDAETAAADFANLTPTLPASAFNNGNINGNVTLQGANGAVNVVDLPQLSVPNGTLTLVGTAGTSFVINIAGNFNLHSGKIVVSGGMGPLDVVYNITNANATVTTMVPTTGVGILLAPNNTINSVDSSTFAGEVIGGLGKTITLMSGTKMQNPCLCGTSPQ